MADFLSQAQHFSVTAEIGFDVVQASGEKLEFGETRQFLIRRPDRMRVDITKRDGSTSGFRFDGQEIAVFNTRNRSTPRPPSLAPWTRPSPISSTTLTCVSPWPNSSPHGWPSR